MKTKKYKEFSTPFSRSIGKLGVFLLVTAIISKYFNFSTGNIVMFSEAPGWACYLDSLVLAIGLLFIVLFEIPILIIMLIWLIGLMFLGAGIFMDYLFLIPALILFVLGGLVVRIFGVMNTDGKVSCEQCQGSIKYKGGRPCEKCGGSGFYTVAKNE